MSKKKYLVWILLVICVGTFLSIKVFGITHGEKTQVDAYGVSTLSGLEGIALGVILLRYDEEKESIESLSEGDLQTQIELLLRTTGIKIVEGGSAKLVVTVEVMQDGAVAEVARILDPSQPTPLVYIYRVATELNQSVMLKRNPKIYTIARTWPFVGIEFQSLSYAGKSAIVQAIRNKVDKQIKVFCNDYLAANQNTGNQRRLFR